MARTNTPATPAITAISHFGNSLPPSSFSPGMVSAGTEKKMTSSTRYYISNGAGKMQHEIPLCIPCNQFDLLLHGVCKEPSSPAHVSALIMS